MTTDEIKALLNSLGVLQAERDLLNIDKQALIDKVLTPEIKAALKDIDAEFAEKQATVTQKIQELEGVIKAEVIQHGATVKGTDVQAVYIKPRISWDTAKLDGLMLVIPQLVGARKEGAPSVTFRMVQS